MTIFKGFGPERILFGSDWPICNLRGPVKPDSWFAWREVVEHILDDLRQQSTTKRTTDQPIPRARVPKISSFSKLPECVGDACELLSSTYRMLDYPSAAFEDDDSGHHKK